MAVDTSLCLYNLTLQKQANSIRSVVGNFSGKKSQEIITATSNSLQVFKVDSSSGSLLKLLSVQCFAIIRSITNFKIAGSGKDYLAVTSDSGNLSILELDLQSKKFISLFNEPFHKSGIRRLSPGQDITVDSKGRAIMLSAIERNKLCYVVNRDLENQLTISSPLEANKSKTLTLTTVGLDVVYENPIFAAIEIDYSNLENDSSPDINIERFLTFYELDLGLNNIIRKKTEKLPSTSHMLLQVPGGDEGPSGVLICSRNLISFRNLSNLQMSISIPLMKGQEAKDVYIVCGVLHKMKNQFFFLVQTQFGDVFKVEIDSEKLSISYFDTLPVSSSFIILKTGFLYCDTEYGDKYVYQFENLGDDSNQFTSTTNNTTDGILYFEQSEELKNLLLVDISPSLNPIVDSKLITDQNSFTSIYTLSGHEKSSALRILQYGISITEIVESDLPGVANRVFTTKLSKKDEFDKYLIISFMDTTLVLSIGESVDEVMDSGLELNEATIGVEQIGADSIIQIHSNGIRVIKNNQLVNEWLPPAGIKVLTCSSTNIQVAVALSNNELVYFEVDEFDRLIEYNERKELQSRIISISLGEIPEGQLRSSFLVVGCQDSTIRVLSTDPSSTLESLSLQALNAPPTSLVLSRSSHDNELYINIGLENGVFVRTSIDARTGQLSSDTRTKYLGPKPVLLNKVKFGQDSIILAFSNKTWIINDLTGSLRINTLLINPLNFGSVFNSEDCSNGVVGVYKRNLIIFTIDDILKDFSLNSIELSKSPKMMNEINEKTLFIVEKPNVIENFSIETNEIIKSLTLNQGESIISSTTVRFESKDHTPYLIVSLKSGSTSFLNTYDSDLNLIHQTKLESTAQSVVEFHGKLLISYQNQIRLYDLGKKQLLSKALATIPSINYIVKLRTQGLRVFVGDLKESVTMVLYKPHLNEFFPIADDVISRHITSFEILDYNTVIGGDKFGNLFVLRCDDETSSKYDSASDYMLPKYNTDSNLNGCVSKLTNPCNFFIDDIVTSFNKGSFIQGGNDIVVYTGLQGTIGVLIPLLTKSDIRFFTRLQKALREHSPDLLGRLGMIYRGYYQPSKNVIDGDLIETFIDLSSALQIKIASDVDKSPREVLRKIFEIRSNSI